MKQQDFNEWLSDYCAAFPVMSQWLLGLDDRELTLSKWREVLEETDLDSAKLVTKLMLKGVEIEPVTWYAREKTASIVRRLAADQFSKRHAYDLSPVDEQSGQRYKCHICLDTKYVAVYSEKAMRLMKRCEFPGFEGNATGVRESLHLTVSMPCKCYAATAIREERRRLMEESAARGATGVGSVSPVLCMWGLPFHEWNMNQLKEAIEEQLERDAAGTPVESGFAAFNQREF